MLCVFRAEFSPLLWKFCHEVATVPVIPVFAGIASASGKDGLLFCGLHDMDDISSLKVHNTLSPAGPTVAINSELDYNYYLIMA